MEQILVDANNGVDAVFAANDGLAQAAINAMQAAGIGPVPVSGQDATAPGIQNILLGHADDDRLQADRGRGGRRSLWPAGRRATLRNESSSTSPSSASTPTDATDAADGDGVVPYFALVPIGVTADNIADTVIADGFRTVEEICVGDVAHDFCQENCTGATSIPTVGAPRPARPVISVLDDRQDHG